MRDREWWHQRGCRLIGTAEPGRMQLVDGVPAWECCGGPVEGEEFSEPADDLAHGLWNPYRIERPAHHRNVEHPDTVRREAEEQAAKLDGWVAGAMRIDDPETRSSVLESVAAHITRTGQVP